MPCHKKKGGGILFIGNIILLDEAQVEHQRLFVPGLFEASNSTFETLLEKGGCIHGVLPQLKRKEGGGRGRNEKHFRLTS